ncbi:MAG: transcriptional regulator [Bdellovibrionales bacterium RIFOXYB1_FULL_37_110]|nr:MAG: transcriptional regulator [Bdellovibrionales bacterium RIFOXYA1_FULL_38_20]OFZ46587.1 MAG: transcriptional regulator [Bdellovibrionales bacterium RIFOXYC1_FULL_37_79]OFZ57709.1 MAG: transcriptional regulator [Bdellovibrionales bacterium RIFOXYB1_FULL_37_110]OFZ62965.1 MAG: transcriptional regulator [Bdellovibrionales bacterium RIFOXYD1_FULL_36_51]
MPIRINLDLLLVKKKMRLTELSEKIGISIQNLSILKQDKAKAIRFSTLEKICEVLECTPGDLLEYKHDEQN